MKITFLVGNGFDISAGVDTSYRSFYDWYYLQPSRTGDIQEFKRSIKKDIENGGRNWSDFEIGLGKYTSQFSATDVGAFFECYEDAVEKIINYLEQERDKFDVANITEDDVAILVNGMLNFYQELNPQERHTFDTIFSSDVANNTIINFISYNYTDVFDRCIKIIADIPLKQWTHGGSNHYIKISPNILHIHGTSDEFPILGIGDETQVDNQELLSTPHFVSAMIKSQSVASIGQMWYEQAESMIENSRIICIWGMSLGLSDSKWWNRINEWLKADKGRHLILFWYSDTPPSKRSVLQYNQQTDMVKNLMLNYSDFTPNEAAKIKNQVHVVFNTNKVLRISSSPASAKEAVLV